MITGSWTYSISNDKAIEAYKTAAEYFKKYDNDPAWLANQIYKQYFKKTF